MKLIYTYFFQYTYILFNNESMLYTYMYLYVIIPTHVFFFKKKFQKQKYFSHLLVRTSFGYYWGITDIGLGTRSSEMVL